ncbi:similar to Saccharomyces cerevisiae YAL021C CCR4 Component of the CCR4-NOT transcriptional complex, which is involved in regulation of gene expression [Maudiozyma saulgeensis]|uniref:CCR4-Not complex 3'-5'-exoribonuclease subunit Ccr4 n=1 Tax=Maudiozyma saulgeensis TaxID=1789683 RepID=A0A1X7R797_9SACH|nr:similar to Saccharomyces cerevisiae YAL021C CCR4 Component of the CCR4-NOT transcriptional complex, which is involved in regulation of gene expression [Kazachstania saulgeensis]
MNEPSLMGYPGMNPNIISGINTSTNTTTNTTNNNANNNNGPGTPVSALHLNQLMAGLGPPGLSHENNNNNNANHLANNSRQLLEQLAQNNVPTSTTPVPNNNNANTNNMINANTVGNDSNHNTPMLNNNVALQPMNINAGNPLFHPHLEDTALLNNTVWKMQLQLASVSMHSMGQPNVYARQNAMKKYLANQSQNPQQPQMTEASLSLVDKTQKLLMEFAGADTSKENPKNPNNNNANNNNTTSNSNDTSMMTASTPTPMATGNNSALSTPTTPQVELNNNQREQMSPNVLLQHKKLSQFSIDDDDELNPTSDKKNKDGQLWHALDLSNLQLINLDSNIFKYKFLTRLYLNGNGLTQLPKEIKNLKNLRVLDLSHNRLTSLPSELGSCFQLKYLYFFDNMISTLPWELGSLFNLQFLGCEGNPLEKELLKIFTEKSVTGLIFYLRDNRPEVPLLHDREFIEINTDGEPQAKFETLKEANSVLDSELSKKSFTILSYNTLCQHYATPKMYRYTQSWALSWDYRREKLKQQILSYDCDVLSLQEVEAQTYEEYWVPILEKHGYSGNFHAKTRAKTMQGKDSKKVDGCCIFFKKDKFKLISKDALDFSGAWMKHKKFQRTEDYLNRAMNKDNVALYLKLQHIHSGEIVWVVTTHLHWDPKFNDVKTFQVGVLLDHMESLLKEDNPKRDTKKSPLLICGDFNSYPDSAVYELFSTGSVKNHMEDNTRDFGYMSQKQFNHHLALNSCYSCIGELPFTNFTPSFTDVIDYIWFSTHSLRVRGLLGEVDEDYANKFVGFPNDKFPSDHIPLIARVEFMRGNSGSRKV